MLDKLINPHWPYLPSNVKGDNKEENDKYEEGIQSALDNIPVDPMNYDFNYHILETDENGRTPKFSNFNRQSMSCLRRIADSGDKVCKLRLK